MVNHFNDLCYIELSIKQRFSILLFPNGKFYISRPGNILARFCLEFLFWRRVFYSDGRLGALKSINICPCFKPLPLRRCL